MNNEKDDMALGGFPAGDAEQGVEISDEMMGCVTGGAFGEVFNGVSSIFKTGGLTDEELYAAFDKSTMLNWHKGNHWFCFRCRLKGEWIAGRVVGACKRGTYIYLALHCDICGYDFLCVRGT